jgi:hypothetical protein
MFLTSKTDYKFLLLKIIYLRESNKKGEMLRNEGVLLNIIYYEHRRIRQGVM